MTEKVAELIDDGMCFACGARNDTGLHLHFEEVDGDVVTHFRPEARHQGFQGIVHGGILSTLLDEVMAHVLIRAGKKAVTARMDVQFKRIARVGEKLAVRGRLTRDRGRLLEVEAEVAGADQGLVAQAVGKWVPI